MKFLTFPLLILMSTNFFAAHHEKDEKTVSNEYVLLSTYEISSGQNPADLEKELINLQKTQLENGYNDCGVYRHHFGGQRAFYTFCLFDDLNHFAKIMDKTLSATQSTSPQSYSAHTDNIVKVLERNATKIHPFLLLSKFEWGPYLTGSGQIESANKLFSAYKRSFGECNLSQHRFGPEMAVYITCGFKDYADFAVKATSLDEIWSKELMDEKLDIRNHSDDLLILVE